MRREAKVLGDNPISESSSQLFAKTLLDLAPMFVMAARQTATMSDNITAYSTAVGPFSLSRKRRTLPQTLRTPRATAPLGESHDQADLPAV